MFMNYFDMRLADEDVVRGLFDAEESPLAADGETGFISHDVLLKLFL